jgi:DNA-directed RNA polymerase subunit beta'
MIKEGVQPADFMMSRVPVLPPKFRPITRQGGMNMVADPNYLYKNLIEANEDYRDSKDLPPEIQKEARANVYKTYNQLVGMADPDQPQMVQKNVKGILQQIFGKSSPKYGFLQRRVIGTNLDATGLGVATPNPALRLNEVGMPENLAWDLYEPFIIRELVRKGVPATQAAKAVENRTAQGLSVLQDVVRTRPVLVNRAPTLHKMSIVAAWSVLTKGNSVQFPPAIVKPYNLDFDGDTTSFSVPVSAEAVQEAITKMLPEKNLLTVRSGQATYAPGAENLPGFYYATKPPTGKPTRYFTSDAEAMAAYRKGEIRIDDPISIVPR